MCLHRVVGAGGLARVAAMSHALQVWESAEQLAGFLTETEMYKIVSITNYQKADAGI